MKEGHYKITLTSSSGSSTSAPLYVRDNQIIGQGQTLSFYGSVHFNTLVLNVSRNKFSTYSPILGDYMGYSFLGTMVETDEGYRLDLDDSCDLFVNINFTFIDKNEGDECSTEYTESH